MSYTKPHHSDYFRAEGVFSDGLGTVVPRHICSRPRSQNCTLQSHCRALHYVVHDSRQIQAQWTNCKQSTTRASNDVTQATAVSDVKFIAAPHGWCAGMDWSPVCYMHWPLHMEQQARIRLSQITNYSSSYESFHIWHSLYGKLMNLYQLL
jgi:hypothetical protein